MQKASKAAMRETVRNFDASEVGEQVPLDRSLLEAYSVCPFQAHAIETKKVTAVGEIAVAGDLAHKALMSAVLRAHIDPSASPADMRAEIEATMLASRPDVQPDVIQAVRRSIYEWVRFLCYTGSTDDRGNPAGINLMNIVAFDGGEQVGKSGQFSTNIGGELVTSEIDFLYQPASIAELIEIDIKSGHKHHSATTVKSAFQFSMHAGLVFENYPGVETLYVRVWNSRANNLTGPVAFLRDRKNEYLSRIASTVEARQETLARVARGEQPETWPTVEKCGMCPCVRFCPAADAQVQHDPAADMAALIVTTERQKLLKAALTEYVDAHGDYVAPGGDRFARVPAGKPTAKLIPAKASPGSDEGKDD